MKTTSINVQITKNPKQYEAVRLGLEATLEPGESEADAIKAADKFLREQYDALYGQTSQAAKPVPAQAPSNPKYTQNVEAEEKKENAQTGKRERLEFSDKRVQAVVRRIEKQPERAEEILTQALQYYNPDEETLRVWKLAVTLNKKN